jgi:hypothetical protein
MRTAMATGAALITAIIINYATQYAPDWSRNPRLVWSLLFFSAVLTIGGAVVERGDTRTKRRRLGKVRVESLFPPLQEARLCGRREELGQLKAMVKDPGKKFAVICGPGGIGKTALAVEVASKCGIRDVWWVQFRGIKSFEEQMSVLTRFLGVEYSWHGSPMGSLWENLVNRRKPWLLVIDNLDQVKQLSATSGLLADYRGWIRPGRRGLLLITSRDGSRDTWGAAAIRFHLEELPATDAAEVIVDAVEDADPKRQDDACKLMGGRGRAQALAEQLGGFPLALRVAGLALASPTAEYRTFDEYRLALADFLRETVAAPHYGPLDVDQKRRLVRYTWELSLDQLIAEGNVLTRKLLRIMSLTADAPIPRFLVTARLMEHVPNLERDPVEKSTVEAALAGLHRHGLVGVRDAEIRCIVIHPLVRDVNRILLEEEAGKNIAHWISSLDRAILFEAESICKGFLGDRAYLLAPHLSNISPERLSSRSVRAYNSSLRGFQRMLKVSATRREARQLENTMLGISRRIEQTTPRLSEKIRRLLEGGK